MTESNEMLLDVKLDLKDGKCELYYLKVCKHLCQWVIEYWNEFRFSSSFGQSWVKCVVKIEAIQCFPCYLKISFFYHDDVQTKEDPLAVIRINIPGVRVETAASRTKSLAYGVFWKNNRKRCKLFFAFIEKTKYSEHMNWLKHAIDSLEDYRKSGCLINTWNECYKFLIYDSYENWLFFFVSSPQKYLKIIEWVVRWSKIRLMMKKPQSMAQVTALKQWVNREWQKI